MPARLVAGLVCWWVRVYTAGLPAASRAARRAEVASDLWEQLHGTEPDAGRQGAAAAVLARWLLGIPDDVLWRWEHGAVERLARAGGAERRGQMVVLGARRGVVVAMVGVAVLVVLGALGLMVIDNIQYHQQAESILPGALLNQLVLVLFGAALVCVPAGFLLMRRWPAAGAVLAAGGAMTAGILVFWLYLLPVLLGLAVSWYAVRRAARLSRPTRPPGSPAT